MCKGKKKTQIEIDVTQIPEYVRTDLLSTIHKATIEYFEQPGVQEEYEVWLKTRQQKGNSVEKPPNYVSPLVSP